MEALKNRELTIDELTQILVIPKHEVVYYVMSLIKFGCIETAGIDDMDEYFSYKLKNEDHD